MIVGQKPFKKEKIEIFSGGAWRCELTTLLNCLRSCGARDDADRHCEVVTGDTSPIYNLPKRHHVKQHSDWATVHNPKSFPCLRLLSRCFLRPAFGASRTAPEWKHLQDASKPSPGATRPFIRRRSASSGSVKQGLENVAPFDLMRPLEGNHRSDVPEAHAQQAPPAT